MEPGVDLAEQLIKSLNLLGNKPNNARVRRDKYLMMKELENANINFIPSLKSSSLDEIVSWANFNNIVTLILKPIDGAGCENVFLCKNNHQIKRAFDKIIGHINVMGEMNIQAIAQPFVRGDEYMINSVSYNGRHFITDIWKCVKKNSDEGGFYYHFAELCIEKNFKLDNLKQYHFTVLDTLGIINGPAHAEIMYTQNGPVLIEVGARISGVANRSLLNMTFGYNSIDLTADIYTNPAHFLSFIEQPMNKPKASTSIMIYSKKEGTIKNLPLLEKIKKLSSFVDLKTRYLIGNFVPKTIDLCTMTGTITLIHKNPKVVKQDQTWILENMDYFYDYI